MAGTIRNWGVTSPAGIAASHKSVYGVVSAQVVSPISTGAALLTQLQVSSLAPAPPAIQQALQTAGRVALAVPLLAVSNCAQTSMGASDVAPSGHTRSLFVTELDLPPVCSTGSGNEDKQYNKPEQGQQVSNTPAVQVRQSTERFSCLADNCYHPSKSLSTCNRQPGIAAPVLTKYITSCTSGLQLQNLFSAYRHSMDHIHLAAILTKLAKVPLHNADDEDAMAAQQTQVSNVSHAEASPSIRPSCTSRGLQDSKPLEQSGRAASPCVENTVEFASAVLTMLLESFPLRLGARETANVLWALAKLMWDTTLESAHSEQHGWREDLRTAACGHEDHHLLVADAALANHQSQQQCFQVNGPMASMQQHRTSTSTDQADSSILSAGPSDHPSSKHSSSDAVSVYTTHRHTSNSGAVQGASSTARSGVNETGPPYITGNSPARSLIPSNYHSADKNSSSSGTHSSLVAGNKHSSSWLHLTLLTQLVTKHIPCFKPAELSNVLYACALMQSRYVHPLFPAALIQALLHRAQQLLPSCSTQSLANILWSAALLTQTLPKGFLRGFFAVSQPKLHSMEPQGLANLALSLGRLDVRPPGAWGDTLLDALWKQMNKCSGQTLTNTLWGLVTVGWRFPDAWLHGCLQRLHLVRKQLSVADVIQLSWACAKLQIQPSPELADTMLSKVYDAKESLPANQLATFTSGLSILQVRPNAAWIEGFLKATFHAAKHMDAQCMVTVIWSLGQMKFKPNKRWMEELLSPWQQKMDQLSAQDAQQLASALVGLNYACRQDWLASFERHVQTLAAGSAMQVKVCTAQANQSDVMYPVNPASQAAMATHSSGSQAAGAAPVKPAVEQDRVLQLGDMRTLPAGMAASVHLPIKVGALNNMSPGRRRLLSSDLKTLTRHIHTLHQLSKATSQPQTALTRQKRPATVNRPLETRG